MCSCLEDLVMAVQFLIQSNFLVFFLHLGVHSVAADNLEDHEASHEDTQVTGSEDLEGIHAAGCEDLEEIRGITSLDSLDENNTCLIHFVSLHPNLNKKNIENIIKGNSSKLHKMLNCCSATNKQNQLNNFFLQLQYNCDKNLSFQYIIVQYKIVYSRTWALGMLCHDFKGKLQERI